MAMNVTGCERQGRPCISRARLVCIMMPWDKKSAGTIVLLLHIHKHGSNKAIVLSDMHVLLSAAKNSTASNIRICDPKFIHINQKNRKQAD